MESPAWTAVRLLAALAGIAIVIIAFFWAMQVLMVRRTKPPLLARLVFRVVRAAMYAIGLAVPTSRRRQQIWALYVPVSLLAIIGVSVAEILVGYTLIFYGISSDSMRQSYINSVSSLSVLGFGGLPGQLSQATVGLAEAFTGPIFVALLVTNLASMYSALNQEKIRLRSTERQVGRARTGPDLLRNAVAGSGLDALTPVWQDWAEEFETVGETYDTVEGYLMIFAPTMRNPWVADVATVLDAANLRNAIFDLPADAQAARCLAEGASAVMLMAGHFHGAAAPARRGQPTHVVSRDEFDAACTALAADAPVTADRDTAWQTFQERRATYAEPVTRLSRLMHSPVADWPRAATSPQTITSP